MRQEITIRGKFARAGSRPPGRNDDGPITTLVFEAELSGGDYARLHPHIGAEVGLTIVPYQSGIHIGERVDGDAPGRDLFAQATA